MDYNFFFLILSIIIYCYNIIIMKGKIILVSIIIIIALLLINKNKEYFNNPGCQRPAPSGINCGNYSHGHMDCWTTHTNADDTISTNADSSISYIMPGNYCPQCGYCGTMPCMSNQYGVTCPTDSNSVECWDYIPGPTDASGMPGSQPTKPDGSPMYVRDVCSTCGSCGGSEPDLGPDPIFFGTGPYNSTTTAGATTTTYVGGSGTTTTYAGGSGTTTTSAGGSGTTTTSASGSGTTTTYAGGSGTTTTSASGSGTTTTSASGSGTTTTSTSGSGTTTTSASGSGTTTTSASGIGTTRTGSTQTTRANLNAITRAYNECLGRIANDIERAYWGDQLERQGRSHQYMRTQLCNSPEGLRYRASGSAGNGSDGSSGSSVVTQNQSEASSGSAFGSRGDADPLPRCVYGGTGADRFKHIISKDSGATYNIEFISPQAFLIYQKPYRTGEGDNVLSVSNNNLYTSVRDEYANNQKWIMVSLSGNDKQIVPYNEARSVDGNNIYNVLQYDAGYLTLRPKSDFNSQKWIYNNSGPADIGIKSCALKNDNIQNNSVGLSLEHQTLHKSYQDQMGAILGYIQSNLAHFNNAVSGKTGGGQAIGSVFGGKQPIKLTVNVEGASRPTISNSERFNNARTNNVEELLDLYERQEQGLVDSNTGQTNLQRNMNTVQGCKRINLNDYVSNRVGECNCNLSDLS